MNTWGSEPRVGRGLIVNHLHRLMGSVHEFRSKSGNFHRPAQQWQVATPCWRGPARENPFVHSQANRADLPPKGRVDLRGWALAEC